MQWPARLSLPWFEYDATGQCVATPFADPPKTARLRVFETMEVLDLIFAWWGTRGRKPQWSLPSDLPDQAGWSDLIIKTIRFPGHPKETTENSVDLAHLRYVHGYSNVNRIGPVSIDGPCLESRFDFRSTRKIAKITTFTLDISASTRVFGLGYSFVEIREHSIGMDMRLWVLSTPVDGTLIDLSLASQVREIRDPRRRIAGLGFLPVRLRTPRHEQVHLGFPTSGCSSGCGHLEPQAVPIPPAPLSLRRRDHALSILLRPVLSR